MAGSPRGVLPKAFTGIWQEGGTLYEKYHTRAEARLDAHVPQREWLKRSEVLQLCHRMFQRGYQGGYSAARYRYKIRTNGHRQQ